MSFGEILVIAVVALIVLGPKRLPEVARTVGQWMAKINHFQNTIRREFEREINNELLKDRVVDKKTRQELEQLVTNPVDLPTKTPPTQTYQSITSDSPESASSTREENHKS